MPPFVQEPQPVSIVQDYAVVSDQEHKVKIFDFKARGRDTQDNWAIANSPIKTDMVLENLKNYPCKDTVSELTEGFLNGFRLHTIQVHVFTEKAQTLFQPLNIKMNLNPKYKKK